MLLTIVEGDNSSGVINRIHDATMAKRYSKTSRDKTFIDRAAISDPPVPAEQIPLDDSELSSF